MSCRLRPISLPGCLSAPTPARRARSPLSTPPRRLPNCASIAPCAPDPSDGGRTAAMKVLGLTGGIGMGKSASAQLFRARGVPVVDTDELARQVVEPGQPALVEV